ncbi:uncharacterized protein A4U43_C08F23380 [Asparagus officinalis]|nr:uncharacterized protein A4U43_C08F23380 [Asparagus officinalis]
MALNWVSPPHFLRSNPRSPLFPSSLPSFSLRLVAVRASSQQDPSLLRKPLVSTPLPIEERDEGSLRGEEEGKAKGKKAKRGERRPRGVGGLEDQILEDTVPLLGLSG